MWYAGLKANGNGSAHTYNPVTVMGIYWKDGFQTYTADQSMTAHDSRPKHFDEMIAHGGSRMPIWIG